MKYPHEIGQEPNLQKIIILSAVLHLIFITLAVVPMGTGQREFRSYQVKLVDSLRTQAGTGGGSGTVTTREKRTLPAKRVKRKVPEKRIAEVQPKEDVKAKRSEKLTREIERIRAISALSKRKKEKAGNEATGEEEASGEETGSIGIMNEGTSGDAYSYYGLITEKIWNQWVYPDLDSRELEIIISIRIDREGRIISQEIEKSSGNRLFDRSAAKALSKASPLPPPPVEMEVGVRFYL